MVGIGFPGTKHGSKFRSSGDSGVLPFSSKGEVGTGYNPGTLLLLGMFHGMVCFPPSSRMPLLDFPVSEDVQDCQTMSVCTHK